MLLFILTTLPLLIAPFAVRFFERRSAFLPALDAFVLVSVGGIVLLHILPHIVSHGGLWALGAVAIGLLLPFVIEHHFHRTTHNLAWVAIPAAIALALHGIIDGMAVAAGDLQVENGRLLFLGVLFHRLPEGMGIWWFASRATSTRGAAMVMAIPIVFSFLGFIAPHFSEALLEGQTWTLLQAVLFGSLIHVLVHDALPGGATPPKTRIQFSALFGTLLAAGLLVLLAQLTHGCAHGGHEHGHDHAHHSAAETFWALIIHSALPALVGLLLLTGGNWLLMRRPTKPQAKPNAYAQTAIAALRTFLLLSPVGYALFGLPHMLAPTLFAALLAALVALIFSRHTPHDHCPDCHKPVAILPRPKPNASFTPLQALHQSAAQGLPWLLTLFGLVALLAVPFHLPIDSVIHYGTDIPMLAWISAVLLGLSSLYFIVMHGIRGFLWPVFHFHHPGRNDH
ncbi:MAG: hypothetical protein M0R76_04975 [Proteobacteria bacterium]|nr:hypothetical protein [Pseudomonadota bacterium]